MKNVHNKGSASEGKLVCTFIIYLVLLTFSAMPLP
jgi:hypothetical protein